MAAEPLERKLAAILYADVAGYSRLTGADEDGTHRALRAYLDTVTSHIQASSGRVVHYAGDAVLAEFGTVSNALSCAVDVQRDLIARNQNLPDDRKVQFRIGINLGEVIVDQDEIYGDGVNVAARLESLADPGGICISESVRAAIGKKLPFGYESLGDKVVKNIEEPVRAYRVRFDGQTTYSRSPSAEATTKPSLAVLPFSNMSGDPEQEYFSDGITEDITIALSNTGWYDVAARHSSFSYKERAIDVRQIGKELGVQYILEGSVRRTGEKVRVTAQLIETAGGKHIWGHRYDGTLADIFDFQDQITETIVGTVEGMFHRAEAERIGQKRPDNMEAYDYLLRGLAYMNKLTPEDTQTALQYFYKAIEKAPGYGRAYAYAFWCYRREVQLTGVMLSDQERAEAIRLMEAGLKADKDDPIVLWQAATLKAYFERDFEGALALLERSLAIDPNSPRAWNTSGLIHGAMGHSDTARQHSEHAIRISPRNPTHWVAYTHIAEANLQDMRYEEAADTAKKALQLNNYLVPAHLILAASCAHLGRMDEAQAAIVRALELNSKLTIGRLCELFPVAGYKNLDTYLDGLRKAGLPD
ncbi:MAG: adenylate/guanylate cyclase domain-containing protein [Betaproteobacteria bacterium]|nr:MAG: adenylate/guanylate cyclase domain-containing protein [Betaproteobacteria bacterium]